MIIGIAGKKKSGKDTTADVLCEKQDFKKTSFAKPIKEKIAEITNYTIEQLNDQNIKDLKFKEWADYQYYQFSEQQAKELIKFFIQINPDINQDLLFLQLKEKRCKSLRELMQWFGTDIGREQVDFNIWVNELLNQDLSFVVIPDIRFDNEAIAIKEHNGYILEVIRPNTTEDNHISEQGISKELVDAIVYNDGSKMQLSNEVSLWFTWKFKNKIR
jgi:hypothetical protein